MTHSTISYLNEEGQLVDSPTTIPSTDELIKGYQTIVAIRLVDEQMINLQRQGFISFSLSSRGEEACSVASAAALDLCDWMYPQYRENGVLFWRGFSIQQFIHLMFSNAKDLSLGRQMPIHFGCRDLNIVNVSSPIGTSVPHAAGCAYAMKMQKEPAITICYFGEGATSEGDFHTGVNFAAVRKVPAIFFCRNNGYAISTPCSRQFASDGVAPKGIGYGITAYRIDGNDFFAIYETTKRAKQACLEGQGPILIEAMTYRLGAHSTADDPSLYRNEEEVKTWEKRCPILRLRRYLEEQHLWSPQQDEELIKKITKEIEEGIEIAKQTPPPPLKSLIEDVYFETPLQLKHEYEEIKQVFKS